MDKALSGSMLTGILHTKILLACSEQDVRKFCDEALRNLQHDQTEPYEVTLCIDKVIKLLDGYQPQNKNLQQWGNIQTANNFFRMYRAGCPDSTEMDAGRYQYGTAN
jgi:hypothetical protein